MATVPILLAGLALLLTPPAHAVGIATAASAEGPAQIEFPPPSGSGRIVMLVSGTSGPQHYEAYAQKIAALGYDAVLLKGEDILSPDRQGGARLQQAIGRAEHSPHAVLGQVAVIGFSLGGGGALAYGTRRPKSVAVVVAYYPVTAFILRVTDPKKFASGIKTPTLVLAGGKDTYKNCCLISTARAIESAAKELGAPMELVVYPDAEHDFIHPPHYRARETEDAWKHTIDALRQHLGH